MTAQLNTATGQTVALTQPRAPLEYVPPAYSLPGGHVHRPANSSELTTLLSGAPLAGHTLAQGDVIQLTAGTTYQGPFVFPNLGINNSWVYVISSLASRQ
jgi:hypothetical protein